VFSRELLVCAKYYELLVHLYVGESLYGAEVASYRIIKRVRSGALSFNYIQTS
jgi:hypothetical protein